MLKEALAEQGLLADAQPGCRTIIPGALAEWLKMAQIVPICPLRMVSFLGCKSIRINN